MTQSEESCAERKVLSRNWTQHRYNTDTKLCNVAKGEDIYSNLLASLIVIQDFSFLRS
jgi:hypothetical protein